MALFELKSPRRRPSQEVNAQHQQPGGFRTGGPSRMLVVNLTTTKTVIIVVIIAITVHPKPYTHQRW